MPIVENPPLARALYATVDIDQEIPPEHYKAVAEVIGFVMRLQGRGAGNEKSYVAEALDPCAARPARHTGQVIRARRGGLDGIMAAQDVSQAMPAGR